MLCLVFKRRRPVLQFYVTEAPLSGKGDAKVKSVSELLRL